ncbi:hypothetical protein [Solimonas aquatica]|uniref:hypothetical protein n=1 Tax=Solimonas aquatica TaxID=489703 RepID=UPI001160ACB2|nr:hypothetical protein [Solimonas aquatica]
MSNTLTGRRPSFHRPQGLGADKLAGIATMLAWREKSVAESRVAAGDTQIATVTIAGGFLCMTQTHGSLFGLRLSDGKIKRISLPLRAAMGGVRT